ncbi:MAG TPA: WG repeat-containing protein [Fluviicola sp.]|nr:WG repeat-containing protein [Fluviicola sp.]
MKTVLLLVVALFSGLAAFAQQYSIVQQNGRFGYASNGKTVIPATFEYATHFSENRALVKQNNLWGYIDSTGKWVVQPIYQSAEVFKNGKANVYVNGKRGLLKPDGTYKVKPLYDTITEHYNGVETVVNGKKGWISNNWSDEIPAEYHLFTFTYDYINAKKKNGGYDLYWQGKLIKTNLEYPVGYGDAFVDAKQVVVWVDGKKGILDQQGNWVVEPNYSNITYHFMGDFFDDYLTSTPAFYVLDSTEYLYYDDAHEVVDQVGASQYLLIKVTGERIGKSAVEYVEVIGNNMGDPKEIRLQLNGKLAYLESDYTIRETPYVNIENYYNWQLRNDGEKVHIVDCQNHEAAVFDGATHPETGIPVFDEYGEPTGEYVETEYMPYLEVMTLKDGIETYAVYELEEQKVITPWTTDHHSIAYQHRDGYNRMYLEFHYGPESTLSAYYVVGSKGLMDDFSYTWITPTLNNFIILQDDQQKEYTLLHTSREKGTVEVLRAPFIELSTNSYVTDYIQSEVEGYYDPVPVYSFSEPFIFYRGPNGKIGLVTVQNKVFPAIYDTIVQNAAYPGILDVQVNGKWGFIDLENGNMIQPAYDTRLSFIKDDAVDLTYATLETHYLTSDGRRFYSLNPELAPFKAKGKCGIQSYNDFSEDGSGRVEMIPALYKSIRTTENYNRFIAQNKKGLYGIINQLNDTIVPFIYTGFGEPLFISAIETMVFPAMIGKKTGYVNPATGATIPAVYDRTQFLMDGYGFESGIQVTGNEKTGLYSLNFDPILPVEYEALYVTGSLYLDLEVRVQQNEKWKVAWVSDLNAISEYKLQTLPAYDLVINYEGYIKTPEGYDRYDATENKRIKSGVREITLPAFGDMVRLYAENGKIGVMLTDQTIVLPHSLTSVVKIDDDTLISVKDGEFAYYVLSINKWFKLNEW